MDENISKKRRVRSPCKRFSDPAARGLYNGQYSKIYQELGGDGAMFSGLLYRQ
jgi:hypothetical protein